MIRHRVKAAPGDFAGFKIGIAYCGAAKADGAEFTSCTRLVTCLDCKRLIRVKQTEAKARFAAVIQQGRTV